MSEIVVRPGETTHLIAAPDTTDARTAVLSCCRSVISAEHDAYPPAASGVRATGKPDSSKPKGDPDAIRTLARMVKILDKCADKLSKEAANLTARQAARASWTGEVTSIGGVSLSDSEKPLARHLAEKLSSAMVTSGNDG